ncbi:hypothetical protein AAG906_000909 [Vitis piasezkii]
MKHCNTLGCHGNAMKVGFLDKLDPGIVGDFNSMPPSTLYQFLASSKMDHQSQLRAYRYQQNGDASRIRPFMHTWSNEELRPATGSAGVISYGLVKLLFLASVYSTIGTQSEEEAKQAASSLGGTTQIDGIEDMLEICGFGKTSMKVDPLNQKESKLMGLGVIAGLVHGDFQIDNLVSHPIGDRVIGILDWEFISSIIGTVFGPKTQSRSIAFR